MEIIRKKLTLEYWPVNSWFEGRLKEMPDVLSQGKTLQELDQNTREDCAELISDREYATTHGYAHLEPNDILDAEFKAVKLDRFKAAVAQLFVLSTERKEKVFAYIEDLIDLESLERRADDEDAVRGEENGPSNEWE